MNRIVWLEDNNVFVIRKGKTSNKKISDGNELVQTYTFSKDQWLLASTSSGFGMKKFFSLDSSNCMDCPYSGNQGEGGCYTHQWNKVWALPYSKYFMASTHNKEETHKAKQKKYRSFIASTTGTEKAVTCPASAEAGFKSNCASCGLCSGTLGKGNKDIKILEH